jgi:hypothetical protein
MRDKLPTRAPGRREWGEMHPRRRPGSSLSLPSAVDVRLGRNDPKRSGRPEAARGRWSLRPTGLPRPPRPGAGGRLSVAPRRVMGDRRDADLCALSRRSRPAGARVTTELPAVRVLARGGGGGPGLTALRSLCLTQRRERCSRVDGVAHQLAERALLRAACGRRGEHVFVKLRTPSDGTRTLRATTRRSARIWLRSAG